MALLHLAPSISARSSESSRLLDANGRRFNARSDHFYSFLFEVVPAARASLEWLLKTSAYRALRPALRGPPSEAGGRLRIALLPLFTPGKRLLLALGQRL
jgi:hypothetical protein